jgi:putative ABC transport system substrate-binding protein
MNRRETVLALLALSAAPHATRAQQAAKPARIAFLSESSPEINERLINAFKQGLRELGYSEGNNYVLDIRWAKGKAERLPELATELVGLHPDVILVSTNGPARAMSKITVTIPIVMVAVADPVASGFVKSLARPGGNITGFFNLYDDLSPKLLELLLAAMPKLSRVAMLTNPSVPFSTTMLNSVQAAAQKLGISIVPVEAQTSADLDSAFEKMTKARAGAAIFLSDVLFYYQSSRIAELTIKHRMPAIWEYREPGGLMSYGIDVAGNFRRAATYVDKILKGTKPSDLPVEQAMKFALVINLKTAKALGLKIPQELLLRANEVIE